MRPVIGVPLRYQRLKDDRPIVYMSEKVRRTVLQAGGLVYPISPVQDLNYIEVGGAEFPPLVEEEKALIRLSVKACDGILFPGGIKFTEYDRFVLKTAIEEEIPVLGICLGMQLMSCHNSAIDLTDILTDINHRQDDDSRLTHKVILSEDSKLFKIIGEKEFMVNSFHLRQVSDKGDYKVVAYSEDGVIEAIEYPTTVFNIGVQLHPEISYEFDINSKKIIDAFIEAAVKYREDKKRVENMIGV